MAVILSASNVFSTSIPGGETYYRFEYHSYLVLIEYNVLKHTKAGVWIDLGYGQKRFVLSGARKRFALPTLEEAKKSYRARQEKFLRILKAKVTKIESGLWELDNWDNTEHICVPRMGSMQ